MSDTPRTQNAFAIANLHQNKRMKAIYDEMAKLERELADARECAEILRDQLQVVGEMYAGGRVPPLPELPWSQPDLSREALIAAVKGGSHE